MRCSKLNMYVYNNMEHLESSCIGMTIKKQEMCPTRKDLYSAFNLNVILDPGESCVQRK